MIIFANGIDGSAPNYFSSSRNTEGYPENRLAFDQVRSESAIGIPVVHDATLDRSIVAVKLRLSSADVPLFVAFWHLGARGMSRPFTFTDSTGTAHYGRFADPDLPEIVERAHGLYPVTIRMRRQ